MMHSVKKRNIYKPKLLDEEAEMVSKDALSSKLDGPSAIILQDTDHQTW